MRALVCSSLTGHADLALQSIDRPKLGAGSVRVRVRAAGVNFADTLMVSGKYQERPELPFVPGMELAGEVIEIASDVRDAFAIGDRVLAMVPHGAFAEEVVVSARRLHRVPDGVDDATAAGFPVTYGTSHLALKHRANLRREETLVVHGAAGGVGLAAVEIGRAMGAKVIATAGGPEKVATAIAHGAHVGIDYTREDLKTRLKEVTEGRGADVIFDPVGGDVFDTSVRALAWEGRLLVIGFASGRIPSLPANLLLVKNASVMGLYWGKYFEKEPHVVHSSLDELLAMLGRGALKPAVATELPLDRGVEALGMLIDRKVIGKIVLRP